MLKKLYETEKIGPNDCKLLIKASDNLGHSNLSKWLREEEISNMASSLLCPTKKHDSKDANNNKIVDKNDRKPNHDTDRKKNSTIVEINGVKLKLNFQPYKFQVSLAKLGCDGLNNIVCVRTGSGKTLVAALVCKYWIAKLGRNNFHAVFIVPTRHLAAQQMEAFVMAGFDVNIKKFKILIFKLNMLIQRQSIIGILNSFTYFICYYSVIQLIDCLNFT